MKLVTFAGSDGAARPGVLINQGIVDLSASLPNCPSTLRGILAENLLGRALEAVDRPGAVLVEEAQLLAPIMDPGKILCIGLNYRDHAIESDMAIPTEPIVFSKFSSAVIGPDAPIRLPSLSSEVDYEAELVAVIGRRAVEVPESKALDFVVGYMAGNDVSARDWQLKKPGGQWMLGKSFCTFAPLGPTLVTRDEIPDPYALDIGLKLNGEPMQASTTSQLIFRIEQLVAYLSRIVPLEPGDLIFTGTPPGVGFARKPPVFLKPGDICEVTIGQLGTLRNPCRAA